MAPPPEVVIILLPLKERTAILPNDPTGLSLNLHNKASAASSVTGIPYLSAICVISAILVEVPYRYW